MRKKTLFFLCCFSLLFMIDLFGREMSPEKMASCLSLMDTPDSWQKMKTDLKENIPILEKVVIGFSGKDALKYATARFNGLSYLAIFSREKIIPTEKFFDIACNAIKKTDIFASATGDLQGHLILVQGSCNNVE